MKVRAISEGYYDNVRVRPGVVFDMDDAVAMAKKDKEGKVLLPRWVEAYDDSGAPLPKKMTKKMHLPGVKVSHFDQSKQKAFGKISKPDDDVI